MSAETKHCGPVDVLETLAGWCNEHGIGKSEHGRRSATYAAVAELIEAAECMLCPAYRGPDQDNLRAALTNIGGAK